jgi:hypothetical protein
MGVRLYPNTTDAAKLEKLAGVPRGTMAQLEILQEAERLYRAAHPEADEDEVGYSFYCIAKGSDVATLDSFLSEGWGKFQSAGLLPEEDMYLGNAPVGRLACQLLLNSSGAMPHWDQLDALDIVVLSEGVHWG